jgi:hypothetical protein
MPMRLTLLALVFLSTPSFAQVRPKIMIIFDTSGSMLKNSSEVWQSGDGSPLCTNLGQTSRIYLLKSALFEVMQGIGAKEIDFGLATYPMNVDATRTPYCGMGKGTCTSAADCRAGETCTTDYYATGAFCTSTPCPAGQTCITSAGQKICIARLCLSPCQAQPSCSGHYFQSSGTLAEAGACLVAPEPCYGCKVSTHNPATQQNAKCGDAANPCSAWYTQMRGTATATGEVIKAPFGGSPESIMLYFDQQEDTDKVAPLDNPEVRAGDGWWTPLGKSLFYSYGYFHKEVIPAIPAYEKACTKLVVAFFTDGEDTCNYKAADPFFPSKWAQNLQADLQVTTHLVAVDVPSGNPNQCTTTLTSIATAGGGVCYPVVSGTAGLKTAFLDILAKAQPPAEKCDGQDNDCDGKVDEDFPQKGQACDNGMLGVCYKTGTYGCKTDGSGVVCNATPATGTTEICDGLDNDCNGIVDDVPGGCTSFCQPEICNGKDDDCNGKIDDGIPESPCGNDVGECKAGTAKCIGGKMVCEGGTLPSAELCDGKDNDCDGTVDGMGEACYSGTSGCDVKTGQCKGLCQLGTRICTAGVWGACQGEVVPSKEICNGIDDDCDGTIDEEAECPGGGQCINGQCTQKCGGTEFGCPKGQLCKDGWCIADSCDFVACEAKGWVCKGGECIDPCKDVTCGKTEVCQKGVCVDQSCYTKGCPGADEKCVNGVCVKDPCATVKCASDEFCQQGKCIKTCDAVFCKPGEVCKVVSEGGQTTTKCVKDPCENVICATGSGQVCIDGKCVEDPCAGVSCQRGEVCIGGKCVADPCETIQCPLGYRCDKGVCQSVNIETTTELLASGGGGCACSLPAGESGGAGSLLLLCLLGLMARRRNAR